MPFTSTYVHSKNILIIKIYLYIYITYKYIAIMLVRFYNGRIMVESCIGINVPKI